MDSINETTEQAQQKLKTFHPFSGEETGRCKHGTQCVKEEDGSLRLWQCSKCCAEQKEKKKEEERLKTKKSNFLLQMNRPYGLFTKIPKRFIDKTVANYKPELNNQFLIKSICEKYIENFDRVEKQGTSMIFCGKPGTGKTHLAYGIVNVLKKMLVSAVFTSAADMTGVIKTAIREPYDNVLRGKPKLNAKDVTREYASFDLLAIDEVGVQVDSDAERRIFFDVINKRYEEMKPTIIISNLTRNELTAFIGERVADRMIENGGTVFAFDWKSYR